MNLFQGKQLQRSRAILELFQAPSYSTADRDLLKAPKEGQIIYNSTTKKLNAYLNAGWREITST
jgi:hypothetical protein